MNSSLQIKGVRDSLIVSLGEGEWTELRETLLNQIEEQASFFQGARVALDVGSSVLHAAELGNLRDKLSDRGITLWAIISNSPTTEKTAQMLGLATRINTPRPERVNRTLNTNLPGEPAVMVQRTLRSGFKVTYQGHVIVIGDVNPGAEVVAGGNVIIWGRLRGVVHAGAEGDEKSIVCALDMAPTQLRISGFAAAQESHKEKPQPQVARIKDGQVVVEPWNLKL